MRRICVLPLLALATFAAPAVAQNSGNVGVYRIGPKDLVDVRVFEEPKLNVERRVGDGGTIQLPLIGELFIEGLTAEEAAGRLQEMLERDYLQRATVTIEVQEFRSRPITVIGAVMKPGNLELSGRWTLFQALTEAGGLAENRGRFVHILRRAGNGLTDQLTIVLDDLLVRGKNVDIPLFANDVINVPAAVERIVFCIGEVERPGAIAFKSTEPVTLLTAVARAGGLTERAAKKILVKRQQSDGNRREIEVNFKAVLDGKATDLELENGDVLVIKESFF